MFLNHPRVLHEQTVKKLSYPQATTTTTTTDRKTFWVILSKLISLTLYFPPLAVGVKSILYLFSKITNSWVGNQFFK